MAKKFYSGTLEEKDITMYQAHNIVSSLENFYNEGNPHFAIEHLQRCIDFSNIIKHKAKEGQRFIAQALSRMYKK